MRLSAYCAKILNISRREAKELIKDRLILVNNTTATKDIEVEGSEKIKSLISRKENSFNIDDFIIKQTENYVFLYKPPFIHSDRLRTNDNFALSDITDLLENYKPLSRLDYEADGVVGLINKNIELYNIQKKYLAIVYGLFPDEIILSNKIDADKRKKVAVLDENTGHKTTMKNIEYNGKYSLIEVTLEKAARHQVRAFCAYTGHPILGDKLYGLHHNFERLSLHCKEYIINDTKAECSKQTDSFLKLFRNTVDL